MWFARASAQGHVTARLKLGLYASTGAGGEREADPAAGLALIRESALAGDAAAQVMVGEAYATGSDGVAIDYAEAVRWLCLAAAQRNPGGAVRPGELLSSAGREGSDPVEGYAWVHLAAGWGGMFASYAAEIAEQFGGKLSAAELGQARRLAETFRVEGSR